MGPPRYAKTYTLREILYVKGCSTDVIVDDKPIDNFGYYLVKGLEGFVKTVMFFHPKTRRKTELLKLLVKKLNNFNCFD